MPRQNTHFLAFNRGLISSLGLARVDLKRTALSAEVMTNWMPRTLGSMMLRPGLQYLGTTRSNARAVYLPFIKATDDKALVELTASTMRVWVDDDGRPETVELDDGTTLVIAESAADEGRDADRRDRAGEQVGQRADALFLERLRTERDHRDRRVLQILFALLGGHNDVRNADRFVSGTFLRYGRRCEPAGGRCRERDA